MSDQALVALAEEAGILTKWIDYRGEHQLVEAQTLRALLESLELSAASPSQIAESRARLAEEHAAAHWESLVIADPGLPFTNGSGSGQARYRLIEEGGAIREGVAECGDDGRLRFAAVDAVGYHRVELDDREFTLAVAPRRCYGVGDAVGGRPLWGLTAQLYSLRRTGDAGIGDFTALAQLAQSAGRHGANAIAVSPLHALFSGNVSRFSPYSPSSRLFLNALHIDPAQAFGRSQVVATIAAAGMQAELARLEQAGLVDWPDAARAKLALLRRLYSAMPKGSSLADEFDRYYRQAGAALRDHARFEALYAHFANAPQPCWSWHEWPSAFQDCDSVAVAEFAAANEGEVRFHAFLQWLAERGLQAAQDAARDAGMAIGLIGDLAVGTDGSGSHAWCRRHDLLSGASVGAPPDLINALGQSWGLTTFSPRALELHAYMPFIEMLRAQLRHVGGLRIDHVIGMNRLWLVPEGAEATQGAYLRYPLDNLFRLTALESWRRRAVIIGEDMGTVPEGFRDRLAAAGILGMRALWFERDWGLFVEPARWPATAVAMTSTHDLPTVAGWWQARDIEWRARLQLFGPHANEADERAARAEDRIKLWAAFHYSGVAHGEVPPADEPGPAVDAACRFVASTPAPLALLPLEDVLGMVEQPNIPGTVDQHPNWRRRLPEPAGHMLDEAGVAARLQGIEASRKRSAES